MPKIPFWVFILLAVLYFTAIRVDIMDIDASQYAEISREMMHSGDYLHIYDRGNDYLDKPPFLFWVSATSMKIFGATNFGYKLPSILFALWALYALYRLTRKLYDEATGRMAALILGTSQGLFLMTNDVRTDTILMSWVITAIWMIKECEVKRKWYYVLGGTASIAFGMMTKGPIALLVPLFCFISDWVLKRQWKKIFDPYHLVDMLLIALFLVPMSIGLYQQFDLHPEKIVNGGMGISGLRFFYWSQSFGRITGESPWENGAGLDFLFSNMLWSYLPWIFLFIPALILNIFQLIKQRFHLNPDQEWISTGGFILSYLALGSSHYQLPHYIFVAFPLASIITAKLFRDMYAAQQLQSFKRIMAPIQILASFLILVTALLIITMVFPAGITGIILWLVSVGIFAFVLFYKPIQPKMFWASVYAIILGNIFMTNFLYTPLLRYQAGCSASNFIKQEQLPVNKLSYGYINDPLDALNFYTNHVIREDTVDIKSGTYFITSARGLDSVKAKKLNYELLKKGGYFKVSELTPEFLNLKTRSNALNNYYIIKIH